MTVLLALTTEQEKKLQQAASQRGLDTERLLHEVVEKALADLVPPEPVLLVSPQPIRRVADLHAGQTWVSEDFDAPLPESFWLGEE